MSFSHLFPLVGWLIEGFVYPFNKREMMIDGIPAPGPSIFTKRTLLVVVVKVGAAPVPGLACWCCCCCCGCCSCLVKLETNNFFSLAHSPCCRPGSAVLYFFVPFLPGISACYSHLPSFFPRNSLSWGGSWLCEWLYLFQYSIGMH